MSDTNEFYIKSSGKFDQAVQELDKDIASQPNGAALNKDLPQIKDIISYTALKRENAELKRHMRSQTILFVIVTAVLVGTMIFLTVQNQHVNQELQTVITSMN